MRCSRIFDAQMVLKLQNKFGNLGLKFIIAFVLYIFSLVSLILAPATGVLTDSNIKWSMISFSTWIRILATIIETTFLPGFLFLQMLLVWRRNDNYIKIASSSEIVFSILISMLLSSLSGFVVLLSFNNLINYGELAIHLLNGILLVALLTLMFSKFKSSDKKLPSERLLTLKGGNINLKSRYKLSVLLLPLLAVVGSSLVLITSPKIIGDMIVHHDLALNVLSTGFPKSLDYPWFFSLYLGMLFVMAKSSSIVIYDTLFALNFLPILAYYTLANSYLKSRYSLSLLATLFSMSLGFGSLYLLGLYFLQGPMNFNELSSLISFVASKTYDIHDVVILFIPNIVAPLWIVGIPSLFMLITLINSDNRQRVLMGTIMFFLVVLDYLFHIAEVPIFIALCFVYALFHENARSFQTKYISISLLCGLFTVLLIDYLTPMKVYVSNSTNLIVFVLSVVGCLLLWVVKPLSLRVKVLFRGLIKLMSPKSFLTIKFIPLFCYLVLFVIWIYNFKTVNAFELTWTGRRYEGLGYWFVPFYVLPVRLGVSGLVALLAVTFYSGVILRNPGCRMFLSMVILGVFLEQFMNYARIYPAYRFATLTLAGFSGLAAVAASEFLSSNNASNISKKVKLFIGFLIMFLGFLSMFLYFMNMVLKFG